jgi:uncharacterized protein (DUF58 family)
VTGFFNRIFWAVALGEVGLTLYLYLKARKLAQGVFITRAAPKMSREKELIEIEYTLSNETGFALHQFKFSDEFDGIQVGRIDLECDLPPQTKKSIKTQVRLNAGMGIKTFKPLLLNIQDELGLFHFRLQFELTQELEVYPFLEETPLLENSLSPEAIRFGFYEISKRGDSNLFIGTRDYRYGDPVKHINWKLSKKTQQVVVNEFEKNTNTFVTLLLDLDLKNQLGLGELSTWEWAKDLALSVCANEIGRNNMIQVLCHNIFIRFSSGPSQLTTIERHFTHHELSASDSDSHFKHLSNLPSEGQVYFVCPMITTPSIQETFRLLKRLKMSGQNVIIFVLDPYQELTQAIRGGMRSTIMVMERHAREEFARHAEELGKLGIRLVSLRVGKGIDFQAQILKHAHDLLEVK